MPADMPCTVDSSEAGNNLAFNILLSYLFRPKKLIRYEKTVICYLIGLNATGIFLQKGILLDMHQ